MLSRCSHLCCRHRLINHDAPRLVGFEQQWLALSYLRLFYASFFQLSSVARLSGFVFLDRGRPCFSKLYTTVAFDVVRVNRFENRLYDPVCVPNLSLRHHSHLKTPADCTNLGGGGRKSFETAKVLRRRGNRSCSLALLARNYLV